MPRTTAKIREYKNSWRKDLITNQQRSFIQHLLADETFNVTNAAKAAGYKTPTQAGNSLLSKKHIAHEVGKYIKKRADRLEWKAEDILSLLKRLLEANLVDLYNDDGRITMRKLKSLPEETQRLINKITVRYYEDEDGEPIPYAEVEWMSKDRALELAMKHFGLLQSDLHLHVVSDSVKEQVILELFGSIEEKSTIIDAEAVARIAEE